MADIVKFPGSSARVGLSERTRRQMRVVESLLDAAELVDVPGFECGHVEVLRLQCRVLVDHFGVQQTLDLLEAVQDYVTSLRGKTPPQGGAA